MSEVKIYIVCTGDVESPKSKVRKIKDSLEKDPSIKVTRVMETIKDVPNDIYVNEPSFNKMIVFPRCYATLDELKSSLSDIYAVLSTDVSKAECEVKFITMSQKAKDLFDTLTEGNSNFTSMFLHEGEKILPSTLKAFCLNKINQKDIKKEVIKSEVVGSIDVDDALKDDIKLINVKDNAFKKKSVNDKPDKPKEEVKADIPEGTKTKLGENKGDKNKRVGDIFNNKKNKAKIADLNEEDKKKSKKEDKKSATVENKEPEKEEVKEEEKLKKAKQSSAKGLFKPSRKLHEDDTEEEEESKPTPKSIFDKKASISKVKLPKKKEVKKEEPKEEVKKEVKPKKVVKKTSKPKKNIFKDKGADKEDKGFFGGGNIKVHKSQFTPKSRFKSKVTNLEEELKPRKRVPKERDILNKQIKIQEKEDKQVNFASHIIVGITGIRGSGVSSTVANLSHIAHVLQSMKVCVINLDFDYRSLNHYYTKYQDDASKNSAVKQGLLECLRNPTSVDSYSCHIKAGYDIISLGFDFTLRSLDNIDIELQNKGSNIDKEVPIEEYFEVNALNNLLGFLRPLYNIIILDFPLEYIKAYKTTLLTIDRLGLCFSNNARSISDTLLELEKIFPNQKDFFYETFKSRSSMIITGLNNYSKIDNKILTIERTLEKFNEFADERSFDDISLAGAIPFTEKFDSQLDTNARLVCETDTEVREAYEVILHELAN